MRGQDLRRVRVRSLVVGAVAVLSLAFASSASADSYVVLYNGNAVPATAGADMLAAGGTLVQGYDPIGVAIARSDDPAFASRIGQDRRVEGVSSTARFGSKLAEPAANDDGATGPPPGGLPNEPATDADTFSPLQWDMRQIHSPQAHAVTGGSRSVLVGDIDTGLDYRHPDLAPNVDSANSVNCVGGAPVPGAAAADDDNGHGTHTAGTIAGASNGVGIVGVAPKVRIAGVKAGNADGFFFPEAVICSFMWVGSHGFDVTNNSYFADPWEYNCRNDPAQRAIWKAEQRAIRYAMNQGVTVVSAAGNDSDDVSHPTQDRTSPDDTTPVTRDITNACVVVPLEIPGVVGVSATGPGPQDTSAGQYPDNLKSFYSSYGVSAVDVTAPGGDSLYPTPSVANRVLSSWPAARSDTCLASRQVRDASMPGVLWCYQQGTSMASPHVAGVAALIVSRYGDASTPQNGKLRPGQVAALISQTADPQACPGVLPAGYLATTGVNSGAMQQCQGGPGHNSWYGTGQADAFNAITHASGAGG
jgi:subtilisin family serine protease